MRHTAARRLQALILTAVFLLGGSGASALDVALYHLGSHAEAPPSNRIAGTDAPRPHGDTCVLLDRAARGPYAVALGTLHQLHTGEHAGVEPMLRLDPPRPADLSATPRPRAPPVPLA